jgi:O-methyltransferase
MFYGNLNGEQGKRFQEALRTLRETFGRVYANDNLIALTRSAGFMEDPRFQAAFSAHANNRQEKSLGWRLHTLTWAAEHCLAVAGDFVECGVYRGFSMAVVTKYVDFANVGKTLYLYDTFEGIPEEHNQEKRSNAPYAKANEKNPNALHEHVVGLFSAYPNVRVVRGVVPQSFATACPRAVAFLHIDMNSATAEIAALETLFDRVTSGGMIVFDDYGWSGFVKQKIAEDAFMKRRGHQILELPTGQGLLIKR